VAIRSEWRARQGTDEGLRTKFETDLKALRQILDAQEQLSRQRIDIFHEEFVILRTQVTPIISVVNNEVLKMFHRPLNEFGLDRILERWDADKSDLKQEISDEELNQLIRGMVYWNQRTRPDGLHPNEEEYRRTGVSLVLLRTVQSVRQMVRQQRAREIQQQAQQDELTRVLEEAKTSFEADRPMKPWSFIESIKHWLGF
jgi:hypothetical protein